ncbi:MAG TPA: MMPL family transporter [Solirubrobacteraceae bacterium]
MTDERDHDPEATVVRRVVDPDATRVRNVPTESPPPPPKPSQKSGLLSKLARISDKHPGRVLAGIGVFFLIAVVIGAPVAGKMHANEPFNDHSSQSVVVNKLIANATGERAGPQVIALVTPPGGVSAPGSRALVTSVAASIRQDPTVTRTLSYYSTGSRAFVSRGGHSTYVAVYFKKVSDNEASEAAKRLLEKVQKPPAVLLGGPAISGQQLGSEVGKDLGKAEGLAFPILFILSLFVFRGVVAALMPLFVGAITVMSTFLVLRVVNSFVSLSQFALNIVIGLGLGLAIDYSLFVVSRYREERAKIPHELLAPAGTRADTKASERPPAQRAAEQEALHGAIRMAGRTISYSAVTVALALASLCVIPTPFMFSMGLGGAITALVAVTVALIALPALLAVLGPRINALAPARWQRAAERTATVQEDGAWYRLSQTVMRRPIPIATVCIVVLLALGIPFTGIKFIGVDASGVPKGLSARTVDDALLSEYPTDASSQITVLVQAPPSAGGQVAALSTQVRALPGALPAGGPATSLPGGYWTFAVLPAQRPLAASTIALVKDIRALPGSALASGAAAKLRTSGNTAQFLDQRATISRLLPVVALILCVLTFIVLFLMTGSVILPLKSLLMTFLSLSAAFGVLVLIFQDGHLHGLLGFQSLHAIDISQPILIFAVAFGLSSDYTVFLLTRIKEARDAGHPNKESVAIGLERTGRIVTQAAVLFCVAIGAFATSSIVFIKEVGVGIAVAVLIDATIIRALLVPSLMALLGEWNWWAPAPLRRLHERIGLSEE